jgi:hypothetical protein
MEQALEAPKKLNVLHKCYLTSGQTMFPEAPPADPLWCCPHTKQEPIASGEIGLRRIEPSARFSDYEVTRLAPLD